MKIIGVVIASLVFLGISYSVGYSKGGHDFALMDHVLMGKLARMEMLRCKEQEDPGACYQWNQENITNHSLVFYNQYSQELSFLAPVIFKDNHQAYIEAVAFLAEDINNNGAESSCIYLATLGENAVNQCKSEAIEFIKLAESSSNK
ncbi:hypothetical protein KCM76_12440 [Zooshikella marina]|uniref:hypothetical protein n=1 Tax=Zooshikella ganghwensis TaxID=202772 RepID=UPI001BB075FC|nr:hypothetical protein [Zooshikella ganghwensis]MBU2706793.1 hypothetical protein [Zooshikella ganghwensis]